MSSLTRDALEARLRKTSSFMFIKGLQGICVAASDAFAALFGPASETCLAPRSGRRRPG